MISIRIQKNGSARIVCCSIGLALSAAGVTSLRTCNTTKSPPRSYYCIDDDYPKYVTGLWLLMGTLELMLVSVLFQVFVFPNGVAMSKLVFMYNSWHNGNSKKYKICNYIQYFTLGICFVFFFNFVILMP